MLWTESITIVEFFLKLLSETVTKVKFWNNWSRSITMTKTVTIVQKFPYTFFFPTKTSKNHNSFNFDLFFVYYASTESYQRLEHIYIKKLQKKRRLKTRMPTQSCVFFKLGFKISLNFQRVWPGNSTRILYSWRATWILNFTQFCDNIQKTPLMGHVFVSTNKHKYKVNPSTKPCSDTNEGKI